jgi:hypothetical protein
VHVNAICLPFAVAFVLVPVLGGAVIVGSAVAQATAQVPASAPVAQSEPGSTPTPAVRPFPFGGPPPTPVPDAAGRYLLHEGEDVPLQYAKDLSSQTAKEGDRVVLTLTQDLKEGPVVVAKAGSKAFGVVTKAEKSGKLGKAGQLTVRVETLESGDSKIKLRETKERDSATGSHTSVGTVLSKPIGIVKHGKDVEIKQGQALHAYVAEDVALLPVS